MEETSEDPVCVFVEILSGSNLLIRDKRAKSSDPYVKVKLAGKDIHQTKVVSKTLNPTYGEAQNNAFVLDCTVKELFNAQGLLLKVKDHNRLSADEDIGTIQIPAMEIFKATGVPVEFCLVAPSDVPKGTDVGSITIRCWPATENHIKKYGKDKKGLAGFIRKAEERAKEIQARTKESVQHIQSQAKESVQHIQSQAKESVQHIQSQAMESVSNIKEGIAQKIVVPDLPLPFMKKSERETEEDDDEEEEDIVSSSRLAKEIPIDSIPVSEDEEDGVEDVGTPEVAHIMDRRKIVVEVIAGRDLLVSDGASSDPYVKVMMGEKDLHKTKYLTKTLNPVYAPELDSTFILDCTDATLSDMNGLVFIVKDWDLIGKNDELGRLRVAYTTLVKADGEPMEYAVTPPKAANKPAGYLLLRCRKATAADESLMMDKKNKKNLFPTTTTEVVAAVWGKKKAPEPVAAAKPPEAKLSAGAAGEAEVIKPKEGEELHLRIEIVSCRNLIASDKNGRSDPYIKILMANKEVHKTKTILKTLNPIFADMDNIFTLHCQTSELFETGGLVFKVKDWDRIGKHDDLGIVEVPAAKLYSNMNGSDMEFKITSPKGKEGDDAGYLTIRCSSSTGDDRTGEKKKFLGMKVPEIKAPHFDMPMIKPMADMFNKEHLLEIDENEEKQAMFIHIVSCRELLVADKTGASDPYVKIKMGKKDLHETKPLTQTLNPVYSSQHNPFYVLEARPSEVRAHKGITFKVKDWDPIGKSDDLGTAIVDADTFLECKGGNMELKLTPPKGIGDAAGFLTVRIRPATDSDRAVKKTFLGGATKTVPLKDYGRLDLHLLIEVVSAWQIPIADLTSSDPYVKVKVGPRDIHETKPIKNTRDPIFTIKHKSVFILDAATKELTENFGVTFKVMDYDMIGSNDDLCEVTVPAEKILEAKGERLELQLKSGDKEAGWLAIRVRPATDFDRDFLKALNLKKADILGVKAGYDKAMKPLGGAGSMLKAMTKKRVKEVDGVKKFRVRPCPDPDRKEATEFMAEQEIEIEAMKPSRKWLDIGGGGLGKVYVEILGADGLPNKDTNLSGGNKTDAFVSIVYEDCVAKTDVIDDCLSPRWLPWMQRAFIFHMIHTSSNMHIGVFDFDAGPGFGSGHDICGRVSIDLANLQPDTEYLLRYEIFENSVMVDREPKGILMLRLRMELKEERDLLLSNIQMPPEFFVNVDDGKDFDLVRQTIGGRQDLQAYSQKTIQLYVDELMGYQVVQYYLLDAIKSLLFWRGQVRIYGIYLPLHSMALFYAGTTLAERPYLYPSFCFFGLAWCLLGAQTWRNNSINPWQKTKTFIGLTQELLFGMSMDGPSTKIAAHEKEKESMEEVQIVKDRIEKLRKRAEEYSKAQMEALAEHEAMMKQVGDQNADTDISTKGGGMSIDPLKFILYPIQQYLAMACKGLRLVKNVLIWDEPYIAYIITLVSFAIGVVFLLVPWAFVTRWTTRILAWLLLGPHMKLVDIFWYSKIENSTDEEQREQIRQALTAQLELAKFYADQARQLRENAIKLKDVKEFLFGRFVTKVPVLRSERFADVPLHSSTATPYKPPANLVPVIKENLAGQHLVGTMIPRVLADDEETAPAKRKEAKKKD